MREKRNEHAARTRIRNISDQCEEHTVIYLYMILNETPETIWKKAARNQPPNHPLTPRRCLTHNRKVAYACHHKHYIFCALFSGVSFYLRFALIEYIWLLYVRRGAVNYFFFFIFNLYVGTRNENKNTCEMSFDWHERS